MKTDELGVKLREIIWNAKGREISVTTATAQIKQAFQEAGYVPDPFFVGSETDVTMMTGRHWYERFEQELAASGLNLNDVGSVTWDSGDVIQTAKRAAGLE